MSVIMPKKNQCKYCSNPFLLTFCFLGASHFIIKKEWCGVQILKNSFETKQNEKFLFEKSMHVFQHDMIFAVAKVKRSSYCTDT
jgi:hypothetical protein